MDPNQELTSTNVNVLPDIVPVELPGRNGSPTVEDRLAEIESVLNIN